MANEALADSTEILFTATQRNHFVKPGNDGGLEQQGSAGETLRAYFGLGVIHILTGYDHLAFVVCILLLAASRRRHLVGDRLYAWSLSDFGAGALGLVVANAAVVEAMIGASIALVAAEVVLARSGLMPRFGMGMAALLFIMSGLVIFTGSAVPLGAWAGMILFVLCYGLLIENRNDTQIFAPVTTAAFGFVHGFGFAGLLSDIGLPTGNLLLGLVSFNLGVEFGQLLVLVPLILFGPILLEELPKTRWPLPGAKPRRQDWHAMAHFCLFHAPCLASLAGKGDPS